MRAADCIFHLASAVGVKLVFNQPVKSIETTVEGTAKVFKAARRYEKPVLLTSTSEVYGRGSQVPFTEHHDVVLGSTSSRRWFYACSKMLDECLALGHWFEAALPVICVRLFNTVGPRQLGSYGMVLPNFVRQAMSGAPITIFGDGKQSRCFCHVADAVGAIVRLMDYRDRTAGKVINIGNNEEITIRQLAECVKEVLESPSDIVYIPYEEAYGAGFEDMRRRVPDLTRARKLIGFCPSFSLDETIRSVADHYRKRGPDTT